MASFLDGLQKQSTSIDVQTIGVKFGGDAGLKGSLDAQFEAFAEGLRAKQIPIPRGLQDFFIVLRDKIIAANSELTRTQIEMQRIDDLAKALNQDSSEWLNATADLAKLATDALAKVETQFRDLQKSLAVEILPPDQQGAAKSVQEFEDRIKAINEWRDAAIKASGDVEQVNREAAQATADAWVAMGQKMKDVADETSEFTRRAFERGFDTVSDLLKDVQGGQIKSWEDFRGRVKKVIDEIAADWLTLQLKTLVLGPDFGKKGGAMGGVLGDLLGSLGIGKGKTQDTRIPGITPRDIEDQELGQKMIATAAEGGGNGAIAAIQAQTTTATTAITTLQTEALTTIQAGLAEATMAIQSASTMGQSAITTTGTTAQGGIEAVKTVAIAAIQAAAALGGGRVASGIASLIAGGSAEANYGGTSLIDDVFDLLPGFAKGGRMFAGDAGIIGEHGPEVWKPDTPGRVIPFSKIADQLGVGNGNRGATGGGTVIHNHINNPKFTDTRSVGQIMARLSEATDSGRRNR